MEKKSLEIFMKKFYFKVRKFCRTAQITRVENSLCDVELIGVNNAEIKNRPILGLGNGITNIFIKFQVGDLVPCLFLDEDISMLYKKGVKEVEDDHFYNGAVILPFLLPLKDELPTITHDIQVTGNTHATGTLTQTGDITSQANVTANNLILGNYTLTPDDLNKLLEIKEKYFTHFHTAQGSHAPTTTPEN